MSPVVQHCKGEVFHLLLLVDTVRTLEVGSKGRIVGMVVVSDPAAGTPVPPSAQEELLWVCLCSDDNLQEQQWRSQKGPKWNQQLH